MLSRIVFRISATADVRLFERTPEHGIGAALVLREDKVGARLNELVQNDVAVVVGVYRREGGRGEQRVQPEDLEELPVFALVDQVVVVGVDAVEEERERSRQHVHHRRVVHELCHRLHEPLLLDCCGRAVAQLAQVLVPHLQMIHDHQRQSRQE